MLIFRMTTVHTELIGNKALISRNDLERLMELARCTESVTLEAAEEDISKLNLTYSLPLNPQ